MARIYIIHCSKIMGNLSSKTKDSDTLQFFKTNIKNCVSGECLGRLCKIFLTEVEFIYEMETKDTHLSAYQIIIYQYIYIYIYIIHIYIYIYIYIYM